MKKYLLKFITRFLLAGMIATLSTIASASDQTSAEIRNYTDRNIVIEFRQVTVGGQVSWKPLGQISEKSARIFRNISIGSVIRANPGSRGIPQEFSVGIPPAGSDRVVLTVQ